MLEIGPGPGGLPARCSAQGARRVVAVERDERCLAALEDIAGHYPGRLEIVAGDAMTLDYPAFRLKNDRRGRPHLRQPAL